jgi:hypothetical protein
MTPGTCSSTVFGSEPDFSEELKKYSEDIIRKCSGLPLATTIIASVLACQQDNPELWSHVKECLSPINNLSSEDMLKEIIGLSYYSLSQQLKTCLLYFRFGEAVDCRRFCQCSGR